MIKGDPKNAEVLFPYLTADNLFASSPPKPRRYAIDFHPRDMLTARKYQTPFVRVKELVLPTRERAAKGETRRNEELLSTNQTARVNRHHRNFLEKWWLFSYPRQELIEQISKLPRYAVCGQVTKRPIFEFIHTAIRPNAALIVFALADDYSFGLLQSGIHWAWFVARCSTLKGDFRYTSDTVFDSFPWPQSPTLAQVKKVAAAAVALRALRLKVMEENQWSLRDLYRTLDLPGKNPLRDAHENLDTMVRAAYGMKANADPLAFLLNLNQELAQREAAHKPVVGPGLPPTIDDQKQFITYDAVRVVIDPQPMSLAD